MEERERERESLSDGLQVLPARPSELGFRYFYRIVLALLYLVLCCLKEP
jgi:hypothetical protein